MHTLQTIRCLAWHNNINDNAENFQRPDENNYFCPVFPPLPIILVGRVLAIYTIYILIYYTKVIECIQIFLIFFVSFRHLKHTTGWLASKIIYYCADTAIASRTQHWRSVLKWQSTGEQKICGTRTRFPENICIYFWRHSYISDIRIFQYKSAESLQCFKFLEIFKFIEWNWRFNANVIFMLIIIIWKKRPKYKPVFTPKRKFVYGMTHLGREKSNLICSRATQ